MLSCSATSPASLQVVPLVENGEDMEVTEENKLRYLNLLAQHRLVKSVKDETEAFLKGAHHLHLYIHLPDLHLKIVTRGWGTKVSIKIE